MEQTDAYTPGFSDDPPCKTEIIDSGEDYMAGSGARFLFGGLGAFYDRRTCDIHLATARRLPRHTDQHIGA